MTMTSDQKISGFFGGAISLSAAWSMATLPEPFISNAFDKGTAVAGAAMGAYMLGYLANDIYKSVKGDHQNKDAPEHD